MVVVAALIVSRKKRVDPIKGAGLWPFYAKYPLTQPEQILFHRLIKALPEYIVLAQVQVSRVLGVKKGFNFHQWNNRINRLSYDFVVCSKDSKVLAVIELDDNTHKKSSRVETDRKKEKATAAASLRLIRWNVKALPDQEEIRAIFVQHQANEQCDRPTTGRQAIPQL